jgi:K(+)-stimulated pyrophosphate-energized sodium pump
VTKLANPAETGPATTILRGISAGMVSVAGSVALILVGVGVAYWGGQITFVDEASEFGGIYGIAVAAIGMLATTGVVVSVDAYGPIADNAGGIAEMAELDPSVREVTDALDSLGNTTAAIAKGFAVGSAALTALALFKSFEYAISQAGGADVELNLNLGEVDVFIGLFIGAGLPFLFAALTIDAVGRAAQQMIVPGVIAVLAPIAVGFWSVEALGGLLAGALVTGVMMAIFMANAGGAWDNAKKLIEGGAHGGKGSAPHKAAVVGDTVGDPFKDTSGPSLNSLVKLMTVVSLVFLPWFLG